MTKNSVHTESASEHYKIRKQEVEFRQQGLTRLVTVHKCCRLVVMCLNNKVLHYIE